MLSQRYFNFSCVRITINFNNFGNKLIHCFKNTKFPKFVGNDTQLNEYRKDRHNI